MVQKPGIPPQAATEVPLTEEAKNKLRNTIIPDAVTSFVQGVFTAISTGLSLRFMFEYIFQSGLFGTKGLLDKDPGNPLKATSLRHSWNQFKEFREIDSAKQNVSRPQKSNTNWKPQYEGDFQGAGVYDPLSPTMFSPAPDPVLDDLLNRGGRINSKTPPLPMGTGTNNPLNGGHGKAKVTVGGSRSSSEDGAQPTSAQKPKNFLMRFREDRPGPFNTLLMYAGVLGISIAQAVGTYISLRSRRMQEAKMASMQAMSDASAPTAVPAGRPMTIIINQQGQHANKAAQTAQASGASLAADASISASNSTKESAAIADTGAVKTPEAMTENTARQTAVQKTASHEPAKDWATKAEKEPAQAALGS
jgi:hypothetical protein